MAEKKGEELERQAHKFLWHLGYFPSSRIRLFLTNFKEDELQKTREEASDIDCWGVKFDEHLNKYALFIDCKIDSRSPVKHIIHSLGIKNLLNPTNTYTVRNSTIKNSDRQLALRYGIRLFHSSFIENFNAKKSDFGSFRAENYNSILSFDQSENEIELLVRKNILFELDNQFITPNPFEKIINILRVYNKNRPLLEQESDVSHYAKLKLFNRALLAVIEIASETYDCPNTALNVEIMTKYNPELDIKSAVYSNLEKMLETKNIRPKREELIKSNTWMLDKLIREIHYSPELATTILRFNDLVAHEYILNEKSVNLVEVAKIIKIDESQIKKISNINNLLAKFITFGRKIPKDFGDLTL